ncbi:MAG TPA: hypothetical protein VIS77_11050 [Burkholderiales bacterium]
MKQLVRIALLAAAFVSAPATAQTKPKITDAGDAPASILYVGNSFFYYNNSLHNHVGRIASSAPAPARFRSTSVTISGSGLDWHDVETQFRPNALAKYSFDAKNNVVFNPPRAKLFDVTIIMDCSQCPVHPQLKTVFTEYAKKHAETIRKHNSKPAYFMSWAYADKPEMTAELAEAYTQAGNDNEVLVIPAGLAFARSIAMKPDLELYAPDKRHPSLAGTYLAAATVFASLTNRTPVGAKYNAGLDEGTAAHLQAVAWETVKAYYGR